MYTIKEVFVIRYELRSKLLWNWLSKSMKIKMFNLKGVVDVQM